MPAPIGVSGSSESRILIAQDAFQVLTYKYKPNYALAVYFGMRSQVINLNGKASIKRHLSASIPWATSMHAPAPDK
jgi:hypothetical protein